MNTVHTKLQAAKQNTGVAMWFWEVGENRQAVREQVRPMVSEQNFQGLHITLLYRRQGYTSKVNLRNKEVILYDNIKPLQWVF